MKKRILWITMSCVMVFSSILVSCKDETPVSTTTTQTQTTTTAVTSAATTTQTTALTTATTTAPVTQTAVSTPDASSLKKATTPKYGGNLTNAFWRAFGSMDPADSPNESGYFETMVFESLTQPDYAKGPGGTGQYDYNLAGAAGIAAAQTGRVAESWETPDDLTIIFHIRKGLRYTLDPNNEASKLVNGREVTADDVVFGAKRAVANLGFPLPGRDFIESWTAKDKFTVVLKLKTPFFSVWMDAINRIAGPYPPEVIAKYGNLKDWHNWVGTGPFIMSDFLADSSAYFVKNPNYWGYDELFPENRLPYLDSVRFLVMTQAAVRISAFRTRKIDLIFILDPNDATNIKKTNPEVIYLDPPELAGTARLFFNQNEPPFNDVRVRRALEMAIDFDGIVRDYYSGAGHPRGFPMDKNGIYFTPTDQLPTAYVDPVTGETTNLKDLVTYQPDKAKALLAEAKVPNLTFTLTLNTQVAEQAQILQQMWKAIGVTANLNVLDRNATTALRYQTGGLAAFKGMLMIDKGGSSDPSDMDQQVHTFSAWNSGGFSSPYYDATYNRLAARSDLGPVYDEMKALSLYVLSQVVRLDFPLTYRYTGMQPWIHNFYSNGDISYISPYYLSAARMWIDQTVRKQYLNN